MPDLEPIVLHLTARERACVARFLHAIRTADTWDQVGQYRHCLADEFGGLIKIEEALTGRRVNL